MDLRVHVLPRRRPRSVLRTLSAIHAPLPGEPAKRPGRKSVRDAPLFRRMVPRNELVWSIAPHPPIAFARLIVQLTPHISTAKEPRGSPSGLNEISASLNHS